MDYENEERSSISITEVLHVTRPKHIFCRLLGLEPFAIDPKAQKLHSRCRHKIFPFICLAVELPLFLFSTVLNYNKLLEKFRISTFIVILMNTAVYIISLTTICTDMCGNPRRFAKIVSILRYCDDQLRVTNDRKTAFKAQCLIRSELALLACMAIADALMLRDVCMLAVCGPFLWQFFRAVACALRFSHLVALVWLRLRVVNSCLRGVRLQLWDSYEEAGGQQVRLVACRHQNSASCGSGLQQLQCVVSALREVSQLVVDAHQPFIAEALLLVLTGTSFLLFQLTQAGQLQSWNSHMFWAVVLELVYLIALLLVLVVPAHCAALQARRCHQLVTYLLMDEQLRARAQAQLRQLAHQLAFRPPAFHLFGAIAVDLGLLFSVISALSTYTVLLITFK